MNTPFLGEICALLAALTWALALVLFKRSGETIEPLSLNLFKNTIAIVLMVISLPVAGEGVTILTDLTTRELLILAFSGVIGIALADTVLFYSLNLIGVGLVTIMECAYTPSVIIFAWAMLAEAITTPQYIGGGLVLAGVFISSTHAPPPGRTRRELLGGMLAGAVAVSLMALGIVIAKPILEHAPLLSASLVRLLAGTAVLTVLMLLSRRRRALFSVFKPNPAWRTCIPGAFFGTYLALIFWIAGFKYTKAAIAAILNQTSTVIALIFATLILKETFTKRKFAAAVLALIGVLVVALGDPRLKATERPVAEPATAIPTTTIADPGRGEAG